MANELITAENSKLIQKQADAVNNTIFGDFYNTGKGSAPVPDSRVIQRLANKFNLKTEEVFSEQTDDHAKAVVGVSSLNGVYQEDVVIHHFATVLQKKVVELAEKELASKKDYESRPVNKDKDFKPIFFNDLDNPFELQSNGTIIPNLTLKGQMKIFKDMTRFKDFSVRDAYTKAANRAQRRVLNQEFRDEIEIDLEDEEVKKVNNNKKVSKEPVQYNETSSSTKKESKTPNNFQTANNVADFVDDPVSRNYLEQLKNALIEQNITVTKQNIKKEAIQQRKDPDTDVDTHMVENLFKLLENEDL